MAADSTLHLDSLQDAATAASPKRYSTCKEQIVTIKFYQNEKSYFKINSGNNHDTVINVMWFK